MADNLIVAEGTGSKTVATHEVASNVHHQRVTQGGANATVTQVSSSATSVTLQASNALRRGLAIHNASTAILYVKFGTTASATSYTAKIDADGSYEMPANLYSGRVDGIWASANGYAYVTETYV